MAHSMITLRLLRFLRPIYVHFRPIYKSLAPKYCHGLMIRLWQEQGRPLPPPAAVKRETLRQYAAKYGLNTLIETGTQHGDTVYFLKRKFSKIVTIELDRELHRKAVQRFAKDKHIECRRGDSGEILYQVVAQLLEPSLFWLDGHYQGGNAARGDKDTPISNELDAVLGIISKSMWF